MPQTLRRIWIQVTADRKRFGLLAVVCAAALLLWARIIVISNPPRRAVADDPVEAPKTDSHERGTSAAQELPTIAIEFVRELPRDPFMISDVHFPKSTLLIPSQEDQGKSAQKSAEDIFRVEQQRTALILGEAKRLTLEAVMSGARLAVIGGELRRVGDQIPSRGQPGLVFTLTAVKERSVILECEGRQIEIEMEGPVKD